MRTLVTGAAGFIGSTLTDRLLAEGHEVVGVDDLSTGRLENLADARAANRERPKAFELVTADVTAAGLADVLAAARPEVVFHLAAQIDVRASVRDPVGDAATNVLGTVNLLEAARRAGVRKVLFASSGGSIYGNPRRLPVSERAAVSPLSPYAAAKAAAELYLGAFAGMYDLDFTSLALGNVYGPRQDPHGEAGVVAIFLTALQEGRRAKIFGDGTASRDYVFVEDVADAFVRAAGSGASRRRLNVGTGRQTTVRELHTMAAAAAGAADEPELAPARVGELQAIALDCAAARVAIGWEAFTDLPDGIRRTAEWIRSRLRGG